MNKGFLANCPLSVRRQMFKEQKKISTEIGAHWADKILERDLLGRRRRRSRWKRTKCRKNKKEKKKKKKRKRNERKGEVSGANVM